VIVQALHSAPVVGGEHRVVHGRGESVVDEGVLGGQASDDRNCGGIYSSALKVEVIAYMEALDLPPHDVVVGVLGGENLEDDAFQ